MYTPVSQFCRTDVKKVSAKPQDRDSIIEKYERSLQRMKWSALQIALIQNVTRFVGFIAVVWVTVFLLRGFVSKFQTIDFVCVTVLLLFEAARLATTIFFSKLLTRHLVTTSTDEQPRLIAPLRIVTRATYTLFLIPSLLLPMYRLMYVGNYGEKHEILFASLVIFYALVFTNAVMAAVCAVYTIILWTVVCPAQSVSLDRYRHAVFERAMDVGLLEASCFDFFAFTFKKLGQDHRRNVQPLALQKDNEDLIAYLYAHPDGVEIVTEYLDSKDPFEQQAAANMVGFWAEEKGVGTHAALLSRLADKLGTGRTGWAAANSLCLLAMAFPDSVVRVRNRDGRQLVEIFVSLLGKSKSMTLVILRSLINLFQKPSIVSSVSRQKTINTSLEEKLRELLYESKCHRTRSLAGYALRLLQRLGTQDWEMIQSIHPSSNSYFWSDEKEMLERLRKEAGLDPCGEWSKIEIRSAE